MAIIEMINGKKNSEGRIITYKTYKSMKRLMDYILNQEKTNEWLCNGIYCNTNTAYEEFILNKENHNKVDEGTGRQCIHFVQSFDIKDKITPELAREIAEKLLQHEQFKGFQVLFAVHTDKAHIHTHFVVNTVNYETGIKWHKSAENLQEIKDYSDKLCLEHNLSIIKESDKKKAHQKSGEYRSEQKYSSWKKETFLAAKECQKVAKDKNEFIELMEKLGYKVRWEDSRKDITFTNADGKKINSDKLGNPKKGYTPFIKEILEKQFKLNRQVERNQNKSLVIAQKDIKDSIINLAKKISDGEKYPLQKQNGYGSKLEGIAFKEKIKQQEIGKGLDWDR